MFENEKVI